jgi:hypothetical protein
MHPRTNLFSAALALGFAVSCASTSHVKELASSGAAYSTALDALLQATRESAVDASSARALSQAFGLADATVRARILESQDKLTTSMLGELERLRRHARLLGRYFEALGDLDDDGADQSASKAVVGSADALADLGKALAVSDQLSKAEKDALGQAAGLVVAGVRERAIARELQARADLIDLQLRIHKELLEALRGKLRADQQSVFDLGYARDVKEPFEAGQIGDSRAWIERRRGYLLMDKDLEALEKAGDAASRLRSAWRGSVEGKFDAEAQRDVLKKIDEAVALAESVEKARK